MGLKKESQSKQWEQQSTLDIGVIPKWIQHVRFTPNGSEKRMWSLSKQLGQKSKLDLMTTKKGCQIYPIMGPKNERGANLSNWGKSQNYTSGPSKKDSACQIYPQWVRIKSAEAIQATGAAVKSRPQDDQEWIHH